MPEETNRARWAARAHASPVSEADVVAVPPGRPRPLASLPLPVRSTALNLSDIKYCQRAAAQRD